MCILYKLLMQKLTLLPTTIIDRMIKRIFAWFISHNMIPIDQTMTKFEHT